MAGEAGAVDDRARGSTRGGAHYSELSVCCSVLQRVAVCYSVLQCVAVCCSVLQCVTRLSRTRCERRR